MALLDLLNEGSFRGAKFLVKSATTTGGRKQVQHDYPNSAKQAVEDLGFKPRSFQIEAIISDANAHDPRSYFQKRDDLLKALETKGNGTLSHPWFSSSFEVTARPYTLNETMTELGVGSISMQFDYNDIETNPQPIATSLSGIAKKVSGLVDSVKASFTNAFNAVSPFTFEQATNAMNEFTSFTQTVTTTFARVISETSPFTQLLNTFREDITSLISVPENLSNSFFEIINGVQGLFDSPDQLLDVYSKYFNFGDNFLEYDETTPQRVQINTNNRLIRNSVQTSFLAFSYSIASEKEYTTTIEVDQVQELLENQYQKLRGYDLPPSDLKLLDNLRVEAVNFLQTERLKASDVVRVDSPLSGFPMAVIAYAFYAEEDNDTFNATLDTLIDLNRPKSNDVSIIAGEISVLTNA